MQRRFLFGASTSPTHSKWNHSIGQPGISQAIILPDSGPLQRHQNSFLAVATLSLDLCLAVLCFLEAAAFLLRASTCRRFLTESIGSLSTRTFEGDAAVIERLRLGRGLLRMTYPGLPTLCCRRRRELS